AVVASRGSSTPRRPRAALRAAASSAWSAQIACSARACVSVGASVSACRRAASPPATSPAANPDWASLYSPAGSTALAVVTTRELSAGRQPTATPPRAAAAIVATATILRFTLATSDTQETLGFSRNDPAPVRSQVGNGRG